MFDAVQKQSLSESVYRQLEGKIVGGQLKAGAELPGERELSELLGVNRGAVREAIKRLQQAGLVAVRHGGKSTVRDYESEGGLELLPSLLVDAQGRIDPAVARSIMALRAAIAPEIAAAAALRGGAKAAAPLQALVAGMREEPAVARLQQLSMEFWRLLVAGADNIAFRLAFNSMSRTYASAWPLLTAVLEAEFRDTDNFHKLAAAVQAKDEKKARDAARRHLAIGSAAMDQALAVYQRSSTRGTPP